MEAIGTPSWPVRNTPLKNSPALPLPAARGFGTGTRRALGVRPRGAPALRTRPPWPWAAAPGRPGTGGGRVPESGARESSGRPRLCQGSAPQSAQDCGQMGWRAGPRSVPTRASLRPPGSQLLVPPRGPKTAGAAAPVAAAACSWRARAAATAAAAASSTSTAGCLGLPWLSSGLWHGLHGTRRGGSPGSSSAQAQSRWTHGARTAGHVASYYGGRFGMTSAPLPQTPRFQPPDSAAAQARRGPA
ncbi:uncharacterized protein LOC101050874 [Saimiri boliviensis]|uniref:uncharacterized protein LOC101050874 n=1 Tax=Saimiri boliviensis TaxID=27679 RepID=UPI003D789EEC